MKSIRNVVAGTLLAGGALLTAATSISIATAQTTTATAATTTPPSGGGGWHGHGRHGGPWRILHKLGLSEEQKASVKGFLTAAQPQMKTLHEQERANHLKLQQTAPDSANYSTVVAEVAQSNATLSSQRTTQGAQLWSQIYGVLTPTQKTQLATLQAQWAAHSH
jgi:Spy/CpxP family protein refolding chaperone